MKICLISHQYPPETGWGGIGTYTYYLSHALVRKGHEVHVVSIGGGMEMNYLDDRVYVHRIKHRKLKGFLDQVSYSLNVYKTVARLTKKNSIEIAECPEYFAEGFILSKIMKTLPLVVKLHTPMFWINQLIGSRRLTYALHGEIESAMEKSLIKSADQVTSCSMALAQIVSRECGINLGNVEVIHNGINVRKFVSGEDGLSFRRKYGIRTEDRLILYLGRLEKRKGIHILAEVMLPILKAFSDAYFVFVGSGTYCKRSIMKMVGRRFGKRAIFTGYVDELDKIRAIESCDFLVIPSLWENFPYGCLEAMACGKPVIGTRLGGLKEIIVHKENGLLFDPCRSDSLKVCIASLLKDKEKTLEIGKMARKTVEMRFSDDIMARETIKVYNEVLSG